MLAELGYVAFAVDMYGSGKYTDDPDQAKTWYATQQFFQEIFAD